MFTTIFFLFIIGVFIVVLLQGKETAPPKPKSSRTREEEKCIFHEKYSTPQEAEYHAKLLMTLYNKPREGLTAALQIFLDESGELVLVDYKNQTATTSFYFSAIQLDNTAYSYHPAKSVYTGATVGGIHTGGVHTEGAYYTETKHGSGNGAVICIAVHIDFTTLYIEVHDKNLLSDIKKDPTLAALITKSGNYKILHKQFGPGRNILPFVNLNPSNSTMYQSAALNAGSLYKAAGLLSLSSTSMACPMEICNQAASALNQMLDSFSSRHKP